MKLKIKDSSISSPIIELDQCIGKTLEGKPGCTVLQHCTLTGTLALSLWERLSPYIQSLLPKDLALLLAACHDIGKIAPGFQQKIYQNICENDSVVLSDSPSLKQILDSKLPWETNHAVIGQIALQESWIAPWAPVVGMHHGKLRDYPAGNSKGEIYGGDNWQKLRLEAVRYMENLFEIKEHQCDTPTKDQIDLMTAFIVVVDWIGSDERFYLTQNSNYTKDLSWANKVLNEIGWIAPQAQNNLTFADLFSENGSVWIPNELQIAFREAAHKSGLFVIEAPMGMGKTEAALWGAYQLIQNGDHKGIFFALPTRTTSDKIHERIEPFLNNSFEDNPGARLIHGTAWMKYLNHDKSQPSKTDSDKSEGFGIGQSWFHPSKRALLQPFGVGTIDQTLLGILPVRHSFLRLFGLADKVVILDEVHSYDLYTGSLLDQLIKRLFSFGTSVIILSATLTRQRREQLLNIACDETPTFSEQCKAFDPLSTQEPYPLISCRFHSGENKTISITPPPDRNIELEHLSWDIDLVARKAITAAQNGEMVLCVMNTINTAQELYRRIKSLSDSSISSDHLGLLHGRFPICQREDIEKKWLQIFGKKGDRSNGAILVSTQVVEQSVDIDADLILTELAPTDMLLQRLGRLWRHERSDRKSDKPRFVIFYPPEDSQSFEIQLGVNKYVYAPYVLWRSMNEWRKRDNINIPSDIRPLLEDTYSYIEETGQSRDMLDQLEEKCKDMKKRALGLTAGGLPAISQGDCLTRYNDSESVTILLFKKTDNLLFNTKSVTLTTISGEKVKLEKFSKNLKTAVILHQNTVSIRKKYSFSSWMALDKHTEFIYNMINDYFFDDDEIIPLFVDTATGQLLTLSGDEIPFFYTKELGVYSIYEGKPDKGNISSTSPEK